MQEIIRLTAQEILDPTSDELKNLLEITTLVETQRQVFQDLLNEVLKHKTVNQVNPELCGKLEQACLMLKELWVKKTSAIDYSIKYNRLPWKKYDPQSFGVPRHMYSLETGGKPDISISLMGGDPKCLHANIYKPGAAISFQIEPLENSPVLHRTRYRFLTKVRPCGERIETIDLNFLEELAQKHDKGSRLHPDYFCVDAEKTLRTNDIPIDLSVDNIQQLFGLRVERPPVFLCLPNTHPNS